jgi:hypothetical protein
MSFFNPFLDCYGKIIGSSAILAENIKGTSKNGAYPGR